MPESRGAESWSTQQLTEFLELVTSFTDARSAMHGAVERIAEAVDAEVVALVRDASVGAAVGFPADGVPEAELIALAARGVALRAATLPGIGDCRVAILSLEGELPGQLLVARAGDEDFSGEERDLLEITETALMRDVEDTIVCLQELKRLGVLLAVDDVGTGYSSLDYLRRFPIDMLKIDKAFVDDIAAGDSKLAQTIIELGNSFGLEVVAEGIEHESQRRRLLELGCRFGQGFCFARPLPADEVVALLAPGAVASPC